MNQDNEINKLIYLFSKLPGLGQRSARRIVLHLLQDPDVRLKGLIELLQTTSEKITTCISCGNLDNHSPCAICMDTARMKDVIAVVETVADLWAMERSGIYNGYYHVLGGALSAARGISPMDFVLPTLRSGPAIESRTISLLIGESMIANEMTEIENKYPDISVGSYPSTKDGSPITSVVLRSDNITELDKAFAEFLNMIKMYNTIQIANN